MNIKEILSQIYPIHEYKKLKRENPLFFWLSILLPLSLLFLFFYLYFYPFGYYKKYTLTQEDILNDKGDISYSQGEGPTDGLLHITVDPKVRVRNLFTELIVEGEDVYSLSPEITKKEGAEIWDSIQEDFNVEEVKSKEIEEEIQFKEYSYAVIDNYDVKDTNLIVFYLDWTPSLEENIGNQLLLKYNNLRIVQHPGSIELRVDEVYDGNLYTYQIPAGIKWEEEDNNNELIAIYSKPVDEENGYIELIVNDVRLGRVVVSSPYNLFSDYDDQKKYEEPLNEQLIKDLNQEKISLGQELYRVDIEKSIPKDLLDAINLDDYYTEKFKTPLLEDKEESYPLTLSEYYQKPFYNYFRGDINELRVGYVYPFEKIQKEERFMGHTPFTFSITGNTEDIEKITFITTRDPIWKNLKNF